MGFNDSLDFEEEWRRRFRIPLETPRLILRPFATDDVDWLARLFADPEANRFLWPEDVKPGHARRDAQAMIEFDLMRPRFGHWAIHDKDTGAVHGWTELGKLSLWEGPSDEIGISYVLFPESWGRGIATEAASRLLRHARETIGLERVMSVVDARNRASLRVAEKLGMLPAGDRWWDGRHFRFFGIEGGGRVG